MFAGTGRNILYTICTILLHLYGPFVSMYYQIEPLMMTFIIILLMKYIKIAYLCLFSPWWPGAISI